MNHNPLAIASASRRIEVSQSGRVYYTRQYSESQASTLAWQAENQNGAKIILHALIEVENDGYTLDSFHRDLKMLALQTLGRHLRVA